MGKSGSVQFFEYFPEPWTGLRVQSGVLPQTPNLNPSSGSFQSGSSSERSERRTRRERGLDVDGEP
jgi:hypothetical protein